MTPLTLRTRDWQPADRVERWRETFGRHIVRADVTAIAGSPAFDVNLAMMPGQTLAATRIRMRDVRKWRDGSRFGDGADDLTVMIGATGGTGFDSADRRHVLQPGELVLFSHQVAVDLDMSNCSIQTLQLPRAALAQLADLNPLIGRVAQAGGASAQLLQAYLAATWRTGLTPLAERHLLELATDALTGGPWRESEPAAAARAAGRLAAARALMRRQAAAPGLQLGTIAARLRVSARTLERDFAEAGTSFGRDLLEHRLTSALTMLCARPDRRIGDVALHCGFGDLSHFNRCFRSRFGCTPSEARLAQLIAQLAPGS